MYLAFKSLHLIAMVAWFAGLFYMFRIFVYHSESNGNNDKTQLLKIMSKRLYYYITWPAMVVTFVAGALLLSQSTHNFKMTWFHIKLALLLGLLSYHFFIGYTLKRFQKDDIFLNSKQCRLLNEIPTFFLVFIIILAVFKPFVSI